MDTMPSSPSNDGRPFPKARAVRALSAGAGLLWAGVRLPVLAVLVVLEPFVRVGCTGIAALGFFFSFFFRFVARAPHFPFWGMIAMSTGFALALLAYEALIRLFATPFPQSGGPR